MRTQKEWKQIHKELIKNAPFCKCGCGKKVKPKYFSFKLFIKYRGVTKYRQYLYGHDKFPLYWDMELSKYEKQAIYGTLLGDSCLSMSTSKSINPRLSCNHSIKQKLWAEHKASKMQVLSPKLSYVVNRGYGKELVRLQTSCHPSLKKIYSIVYVNGRKKISEKWLDSIGDVGLAWWICDDGSGGRNYIRLHTEGFSKQEVEIIFLWMQRKFEAISMLKSKGKYYFINIRKEALRKILLKIKKHIPECMQYKLRNCNVC